MKHSFAELSCIALLWTGSAGVAASLYIGHTQGPQLQSLCAFSMVIAMGCIAKMTFSRADAAAKSIAQI